MTNVPATTSLTARPVTRGSSDYVRIRELMATAFPEAEQMPMWLLRLMALRRNVEFSAMYDGDELCGVLYTVESERYVFVLYLATFPEVRSRGYGGRILDFVKERAGGRGVVLNVERPDETAANAEQRLRRVAFYARNGIVDTGRTFTDGGVEYAILSTDGPDIDMEAYGRLLRGMSFGLFGGSRRMGR